MGEQGEKQYDNLGQVYCIQSDSFLDYNQYNLLKSITRGDENSTTIVYNIKGSLSTCLTFTLSCVTSSKQKSTYFDLFLENSAMINYFLIKYKCFVLDIRSN